MRRRLLVVGGLATSVLVAAPSRVALVSSVLLIAPACEKKDCTITITSQNPLPDGRVGYAYFVQLTGTGGLNGKNYAWQQSGGTIPDGMKLSKDGALDGKPTAAGTYEFGVTAWELDLNQECRDVPFGAQQLRLTIAP